MLEIGRSYSKTEMTQILATKSKQGIDRKLSRYGVEFDVCGRGEKAIYMKESERTASASGTQQKFTRRMVMTSLWCRGFYSTVLPQLRNGILELSRRE